MKNILKYIILGVLTACSSSIKTLEFKSSNTYEDFKEIVKTWEFIIYEKSIEVEIIEYYPAFARCNRGIINALAIVRIDSDTIRVIDQCPGNMEYKKGDKLRFEPDTDPPMENSLGLAYIEGGSNPAIFQNQDVTITTFGYLNK